jgi:hypothetical protein
MLKFCQFDSRQIEKDVVDQTSLTNELSKKIQTLEREVDRLTKETFDKVSLLTALRYLQMFEPHMFKIHITEETFCQTNKFLSN